MPSQNQSNQGRGRGFAGMDEERQREIASMGGKAAHQSGHAHEFTPEEAREAGRKGGEASHGGRSSSREDERQAGDRSARGDERQVSARSARDEQSGSRSSSSSKSGSGRSSGGSRGR
ncbi:MAG: KGG domain-containing protein [Polyangia bacterium]